VLGLARTNAELAVPLDPALPCTGAEALWAVRHEMARTVEDVLARRCRALFLNAAAARRMAPALAALIAGELGRGDDWIRSQLEAFSALADGYSATSIDRLP
jgi:glycerol-3-phosphate dehydrogenase